MMGEAIRFCVLGLRKTALFSWKGALYERSIRY